MTRLAQDILKKKFLVALSKVLAITLVSFAATLSYHQKNLNT